MIDINSLVVSSYQVSLVQINASLDLWFSQLKLYIDVGERLHFVV